MNKLIITLVLLCTFGLAMGQSKKELLKEVEALKGKVEALEKEKLARTLNLEDSIQKLSYAIGVNIASSMTAEIEDISPNAFQHALQDVLNGETKMTIEEASQFMREELTKLKERKATAAKAEGEKFLAENAKKDGIVVTPSGLQYEVLQKGEGPMPEASDRVKVHYEGKLVSGKVFDSSIARGEPVTFGVSQVIKGWTEALQLMPTGSKWRLYIPQQLAYGERGAGRDIPAYAPLIFEVELIEIESK